LISALVLKQVVLRLEMDLSRALFDLLRSNQKEASFFEILVILSLIMVV